MALVLADRVQETTTTTGTGTVTLAGAVSGYQSFATIGNGNTTYYTITSGTDWEVGIGTYTSSGTTLARTTILSSSAGGTTKISLTGTSTVFVSLPSERVGVLYTPVKTATYNANVNDGVQTNTSGGAFTVNLPASPAVGDQVVIVDSNSSWATNNLTVGRNGSTIQGSASDLICDISGVSIQLIYTGTTWDVFAQAGGAGAAIPSPGTSGNLLTSNGTAWVSQAPAASGVSQAKATALSMILGF